MVRIGLVVLDGVVAVTAIGGGIALATGLEGKRFPPTEVLYLVVGVAMVALGVILWSP